MMSTPKNPKQPTIHEPTTHEPITHNHEPTTHELTIRNPQTHEPTQPQPTNPQQRQGIDVYENEQNVFFEDWTMSEPEEAMKHWDRRLKLLTSFPQARGARRGMTRRDARFTLHT
jgi:hypothetical protein